MPKIHKIENKVKLLDHAQTIDMSYETLFADPDTRTTDTIYFDICLTVLITVVISLVLLNYFADPSYTIETFCKLWCHEELMLLNRLLIRSF